MGHGRCYGTNNVSPGRDMGHGRCDRTNNVSPEQTWDMVDVIGQTTSALDRHGTW